MKMTRTKLKGIVKECLVEILSEGIAGVSSEISSQTRNSLEIKKQRSRQLKQEQARLEAQRARLETKIEDTVSNLTENEVMREIFADTARTTLQEQMNHDGGPGGGSMGNPGISLDNIFSESSQKWSQLAFTEKKIT